MARLDTELAVVGPKGIAAYFLIVEDFTRWAKAQGIGVGPGRGSAAGSIIAYSLGITALDPIANGLLFERFLNPERTEMPDIDMDFDDERRLEVIEYVREKYGADKVAQIITFNKMKARAAVRDAGRVMGYPYGVPDKISKMIGAELDATIASSLKASTEFTAEYGSNPDTKRIVDAASAIEGMTRGEGVHAAGVVICRDPLHFHVPVKYDTKGGAVITQYDGPTVALMGLLKMDFLGLRTLTVIAKAVENVERLHGIHLVPDDFPLDDPDTFALLQRADTVGVFQVESAGMRQLLKRMKPETFGDIVAILALYRPGPLKSGMVDDFVDRKRGNKAVTYYDDRLKPILEETYGAIVYQEQVMRISMEMSGFSAAKADKLRKAMGKKKLKDLEPLKAAWVEGAVERGYDPKLPDRMWTDIEKFAEYAFNKSHSAAYGVITMQTAYLKAHYPIEYMAAVLTSYSGKTDKIVHYVAECNRAGYTVLPPDVNSSGKDFTPVPGEGIRFGLEGIRGVGAGVVDLIVEGAQRGRALHVAAGLLRAGRRPAGQQEDDRGAHQGRRVRLDRLHAQAPALDDGQLRRQRGQARARRRHRAGLDVRPLRRGLRVLGGDPRARRRRVGQEDEARLREGDARHLRLGPPAARDRRRGAPRLRLLARRRSKCSRTAPPGGSRACSRASRSSRPRRAR